MLLPGKEQSLNNSALCQGIELLALPCLESFSCQLKIFSCGPANMQNGKRVSIWLHFCSCSTVPSLLCSMASSYLQQHKLCICMTMCMLCMAISSMEYPNYSLALHTCTHAYILPGNVGLQPQCVHMSRRWRTVILYCELLVAQPVQCCLFVPERPSLAVHRYAQYTCSDCCFTWSAGAWRDCCALALGSICFQPTRTAGQPIAFALSANHLRAR